MQSFKDNMIVQMHALSSREQVSLINQIWDIAYKVVNSFILYHWIQNIQNKRAKNYFIALWIIRIFMLIEDRLANILAKYTCPILVSVFCQHVNNVIGEWYHTDSTIWF